MFLLPLFLLSLLLLRLLLFYWYYSYYYIILYIFFIFISTSKIPFYLFLFYLLFYLGKNKNKISGEVERSLHWEGEARGLRGMRIEKKWEEEGQHNMGDFLRRRSWNFQEKEQILLWGWTPLKIGVAAWEKGKIEEEEGNHLRIFRSINTCHGRWENAIGFVLEEQRASNLRTRFSLEDWRHDFGR